MDLQRVLQQFGHLNQSFLWASCLWSAVACGYMVYGRKQQSMPSFIGGLVMLGISFFAPALTMTLISVAIMIAVFWLTRHGY